MNVKRFLFFLVLLFWIITGYSQQFGFEWIRPYQPYYKFKITQPGIYKIDAAVLNAAGINTNGVDPKRFQIFHNGREQYIYVHGQDDGIFHSEDFIEFYAQQNDGQLDSQLYTSPAAQPHTWYSLITDTSVYFLTILPDTTILNARRLDYSTDNDYAGKIPEPYFVHEAKFFRAEEYVEGINLNPNGEKYNSSEFTDGEGWGANRIGLGQSVVYPVPTPFVSNLGNQPNIEVRMAGVSDYYETGAPLNHHVVTSIAPAENPVYTQIDDRKYKGYITQKFSTTISTSNLGVNTTNVRLAVVNDLSVGADYNVLLYIKLTYSRQYNLGGQTQLKLNVGHYQGNAKSYLQFQQFGTGSKTNPILYDFLNNKRVKGTYASGNAQFLVENTGQPAEIFVFDSSDIQSVQGLQSVNFNVIDPAQNYEFIILTHPVLANAANQYATYRSQQYKVLKVESQQLYDYYTYGNTHPLAVRRMARHLLLTQTVAPQYLLLLGKGYQTNLLRTQQFYESNLVTAIGNPASDVMFTAGIIGSGFEPDIPTGRIAAANEAQAQGYLDKLIYYETTPDSIQEWRKQVLHLSGGTRSSEQQAFRAQMNAYRNIIQGNHFGAYVSTYNKSNSDPVQNDLKEELVAKINNGISLLTFLGHGSATVLDINIGNLSDLTNLNKYPLFYFNGCNVGNPSDVDPSNTSYLYGRDYVCAANKGAIGWLGHSNLTLDGKLYAQMNSFYNRFCGDNYGRGIADIIKSTCIALVGSGTDVQMRSHCLQLTLQGDPAVRIYSPGLPDYKIESKDLYLFPNNTNAKMDSFAVGIIVTNQAKTNVDSFTVDIIRTMPSGIKVSTATKKYASVYFKDTVYVWFEGNDPAAAGNNTFEVTIDKQNLITESNKSNNTASFTRYIPGTGVKGLLPVNCSIVSGDSVELVLQNNDLFITGASYLIEMDVTPSYSSPQYITSGVIQAGAIAKWKVKLHSTDTTVYFWRTRLVDAQLPAQEWEENSFTHIPNGNPGWSQSHYGQYSNAAPETNLILFDSLNQRIEFVPSTRDVSVSMARWWHGGNGIKDPYGTTPSAGSCISSGIILKAYDSNTPDISVPGIPTNCNVQVGADMYRYYALDTRTLSGQLEFARIIDSAKTGTYFAVYSFYDAGAAGWGPEIRNAFAKIGSIKAANISSYYSAFAMIGKKGEVSGSAEEDTVFNDQFNGQTTADSVIIAFSRRLLEGKWHTGTLVSKPAGPALNWQKVYYNFNSTENAGTDKTGVNLYVVKNNGQDSLIFQNIPGSGFDISSVDAKLYPYMKIAVQFEDSQYRTPNQFGYWMITYEQMPEGAINAQIASDFYNSPIEQGDSLKFRYAFENLTNRPFDSLDVDIKITDANRIVKTSINDKIAPLAGNTVTFYEKKLGTLNLEGENTFSFSVNGSGTQAELDLNNNFVNVEFNVKTDQTNPVLDVTFDGYRIMNGDFVSPTPVIHITSKDDNKYKLQSDTSTFVLFLKKPNQTDFERVDLNSNQVKFYPATEQLNKAAIDYKPGQLPNGKYTLRVQTKDASGNLSAKNAYEVDFEVINESTITNFFPYPNPGTTNIRFVFTLTGGKVPDQLLIRILTISGKIVREINRDEFGAIKIGNNISEFAWDGTDQFGDRLANGVYLYQVFTRIDGNKIDSRATAADKYVMHNTGKIYLMK